MIPRLIGLLIAVACGLALNEHETRAQDPEAIVRVQAGNSLGSGTVFYRSTAGDAFVLTNHHVAGRKGSRVAIEFWVAGKLQPKVPAIVVEAQIDGAYTDVSIVRVAKADLGSLNPPYIPLAAPGTQVDDDSVLSSRGCPGGVWQSQFIGRTSKSTPERMEFAPRPGGGRSGSSVMVVGKNEIAGLLTWSTGKPNYEDHGTDGSNYQSGIGIAQQIDSVWRVIRGQTAIPADERPEHFSPLYCERPGLSRSSSNFALSVRLGWFPMIAISAGKTAGVNPAARHDETQILRRPWRSPRQPDPQPSPQPNPPPSEPDPAPQPGAPLPEFDKPSEGPQAAPDPDPQAEPNPDPDGLLRRRFGEPVPPDNDPPADEDRWRGRDPAKPGPIRGLIDNALGAVRFLELLLAIYGGWCLFMKFRKLSVAIVPIAVLCLAAPACGQDPELQSELERKAELWQSEPAAATKRWADYGDAYAAAKADKAPLLVLVTMPGCAPCTQLKSDLHALDAEGYLNNTHTAIVDSGEDAALAAKFSPTAFPLLVACVWDEEQQKYVQTARHVGAFGLRAGEPEPQSDGTLHVMITVDPPLTKWLTDAGIK